MKAWSLGYEKAKDKAKKIYDKIGTIYSPALRDEVDFTSKGFKHLVRKGKARIPRTKNEQKRRFVLLPHVEMMVKNPNTEIEVRSKEITYKVNRYGKKILKKSDATFWTFKETIKGCEVKTVVMQIGDGRKHFISVMGDGVKITKRSRSKKSRN